MLPGQLGGLRHGWFVLPPFRCDGPTSECYPMYTYLGHSRALLLPRPASIYQLLDIKCVSNLYTALMFLSSVGYLLLH